MCPDNQCIEIYKNNLGKPVITHQVKDAMRPYLHPIIPPDGLGVLTEIEPAHHLHQTGIYWGLKNVNGRDFFKNNKGDYYQKEHIRIIQPTGSAVSWESVYNLLDEQGRVILQETQLWALSESNNMFFLDLTWTGKALKPVTIERFFVGGLFLRMPWHPGIDGRVVNAMSEVNYHGAEGHRAIWVDIGMDILNRSDWGHISILDHPDNVVFPTPWRVDEQLGVGPSRQILGDYTIEEGSKTTERYRMVIYTGDLDHQIMSSMWRQYICEN